MKRPFKDFPAHVPNKPGAQRPLSGMKVVDFTHFVAGPFATMMLGDFGAEVIKIESPRGDDFRQFPPADPALNGEGSPFLWTNRNKKSIVVNLKSEEGQQVVRELIKEADIIVENFSTGVMERFGLGYDDVKKINENIIFCSASAYGRTGPYADRTGFDTVVQAESGFISMNGFPDREGVRAQPVVMDTTTALMACNAILAAVVHRLRTGKGQRIDVSLYESSLIMLGFGSMQYLQNGIVPPRVGNSSNDTQPTGTFHASDSAFFISSSSTAIFRRVFEVIGRPDVANDPELQDRMGRLKKAQYMKDILEEAFGKQPWSYWEPKLRAAGAPAGKINELNEALEADVTRSFGVITKIPHPTAGEIPNLALPMHFSESPLADPVAAPTVGQHTNSILKDMLGYDDARIAALESSGAIGKAK